MAILEANNAKLADQVADHEVEIAKKDEEIRQLHTQSKEGLDRIRNFIGNPGDIVNKAQLFDNEIKSEWQLLTSKIVNVLVEFVRKREATLVEMPKLLLGPQPELFRLPIPSPTGIPLKHMATIELNTLQQHHLGKEPITGVKKVVTPVSSVQVKTKMTKKGLETPKTMSSNPFSRRVNTRKKKILGAHSRA